MGSPEVIKDLILKDERVDSRKSMEFREIKTILNYVGEKAEGSCYVEIGNTKVVVGIKFGVMQPYPDSLDEGGLMVSLNYAPIVWQDLPAHLDVELSRVLDRSIRESKMLDLKKFCIKEGEKSFQIFIDGYVMNYDGNLLDALNLATVKALMNMKMPMLDESGKITGSDKNIELDANPVMVTVSRINNKYLIDLNKEEELAADFSLSISYMDDKTICAMQKFGIQGIPMKEIDKIFDIGNEKQNELRKLLK